MRSTAGPWKKDSEDWEFCENMVECQRLFRVEECEGGTCPRERSPRESIMIWAALVEGPTEWVGCLRKPAAA